MNDHVINPLKFVPLSVLALCPLSLSATGFRVPDQDAFATARGEAFVATADNPSAIFYNPAGITQLEGHNFRGGIYAIDLEPNFKSTTTGRDFGNKDAYHGIPQLFYTYSGANDSRFSYGLGIYSPYGLGIKWPQDTGFRTIGTKASLTYMTINPVAAVKILPNLSLGAGITVNYSDIDLEQGIASATQPTDIFQLKGSGWDVGYNLGLLWKPHDKISFGASFHSTTTVDLKGHTFADNNNPPPPIPVFSVRQDAHANFAFPLNAVVGVSYRPNEKWNFEFNADYTDWSRVKTVTIKQAAPYPPLFPQNIPIVLNWESSWYYEFGGTRYFGNGWSISAGYIFNENSIPDARYTPLVPDLDRHFFSVGTGYKGRKFSFDVAYQLGYGPDRKVSTDPSAYSVIGQSADGTYSYISHAIIVSAGWHF